MSRLRLRLLDQLRLESNLHALFGLHATSASGKPVQLRGDYDAGYGDGAPKEQSNRLRADLDAFLFEQLRPQKSQ